MQNLKATFETLVDAFVFLDKNKDGYVSKSEMVEAITETTSGERSSGRIGMKRFGQYSLSLFLSLNNLFIYIPICMLINLPFVYYAEEMDWDKNGAVNFKEFLFAFTGWVGIEDDDDEDDK